MVSFEWLLPWKRVTSLIRIAPYKLSNLQMVSIGCTTSYLINRVLPTFNDMGEDLKNKTKEMAQNRGDLG